MTDRINISYCANSIAAALHRALKAGDISRIGRDEVNSAIAAYLAAGPHVLSKYDMEQLTQTTFRKVVEKA